MSAFENLNPVIQEHIKQITKSSGLPDNEESYELLAGAWEEKKNSFESHILDGDLLAVEFFSKDEPKGAIALSYSGSLLTIGPLVDGQRNCEYASVGLRTDVPGFAKEAESVLAGDIEVDSPVEFKKGPVKSSSPLWKIAVAREKLDAEEEAELLTEITQAVVEDFVEVNKTVIK